MEREDWESNLGRVAALVRESRYVVALTGAGISTPSGVPDFRTPGEGLWEKVDPMAVASLAAFRRDPASFFHWVAPLIELMRRAKPNPAHLALAQLEAAGVLKAVITQNIDGLHQAAGSRRVLELHGSPRTATCLDCFHHWPGEETMAAVARGEVPRCPACGGILKPDVILFGEQLPALVLDDALEEVRRADLILVAGSSLMIAPAANMPARVSAHGGSVIIFNRQATYADAFAVAIFRQDVAVALPRLAALCLEAH